MENKEKLNGSVDALALAMRKVVSEAAGEAVHEEVKPLAERLDAVEGDLSDLKEDMTEIKTGMTDIKDYMSANPK